MQKAEHILRVLRFAMTKIRFFPPKANSFKIGYSSDIRMSGKFMSTQAVWSQWCYGR